MNFAPVLADPEDALSLLLELPYPLPGDVELIAEFAEGGRPLIVETVAT